MSDVSERIANLSSQEKRILLAQLLRQKANRETSSYPLSYGQKALWFLYQSAPENAAYNTAFTARIRSHVDVHALRRAFQSLIDRHPSLRTTFSTRENGEPVQQIHGYQEVCFEQTDASAWTWDELNERVIEAYRRPFDLERGPVMRVNLFTRSEQDHILLLIVHHLVYDGWSLWILLDELRVLYPAKKAGTPDSLSPLKLSYTEYIQKQNEMLAGPVGEELWAYWSQQLSGELPVLNLPTDHPRPPVQTYNGASYPFRLSKQLTQQLKKLARAEGVTLYMLLLAAFQVLLHRYTGQKDILIGSLTTGRSQTEFAEVVGYFVNPVVLRADFSDNPIFQKFLSQVHQTVLGALEHQEYPFPLLVEKLHPSRDPSRSPLFQVVFTLQKPQQFQEIVNLLMISESKTQINWGDLELEPFEMAQQEGQFDVSLEMIEARDSILSVFKYNTDLFNVATITKMAEHLQTLLGGIVDNPQQRISELPILSKPERHQILVEWNNTNTDYPKDKCLHELFEAQVERTPDAVALRFEEQQLTYRELNQRANQLACYLRALSVKPETLVGIFLERSIDILVGILGTLKAGAAYVPLDITYPKARLTFMLQDTQAPIVITQQHLSAKLPEFEAKLIYIDTQWASIAQESNKNLENKVTPNNLAYIIYTSGSTGKPKGVMIHHKGLVNYLCWAIQEYAVVEGHGSPVNSPLGFDATITSLFSPLLVGRCVVLLPEENEIEALVEALQSGNNFSLVKITPTLLKSLGELIPPEKAEGKTRAMILGGEALFSEHISFWRSHAPTTRLINEYGPTETVVGCCIYEVPREVSLSGSVPIGKPIANTQLYILNTQMKPVPIGVPGELYIGGDGVARGYLNRPDLTNEKFIKNPFSNESEMRLYKTGDLARYLSDGNIEFLGRVDHQVKIRGFRIELGEIETILSQHSAIWEAVVIAREDRPGDKRLVAYIVGAKDEGQKVKGTEIRKYLKEILPEYMIPSAFVILEALPLTPNGKVDRRALPAPERSGVEKQYVAPRTPTEERLAKIWAEVLGFKQIGIHDNFFEVGGDSILSLQIIARSNQAGLKFTPQDIFRYQTIAELAAVAEESLPIQAEQGIVTGSVPLTPIQHWFFEQHLPEPHHFNQSVLLEVPPDLQPDLLEQVIQQLFVHHDALRLRFLKENSVWQQSNIGPEGTVPFTEFDFSERSLDDRRVALESAAADLQGSLNLTEGPLMRVALFHFGPDTPGRLLLVIHHLAIDGVSWRILLEDLQTAYQQLSQGTAIQLPPKTTSFKEWASRLTEYSHSEALISELDYWLAESWASVIPLPIDYPSDEEANTVASAVQISTALDIEQTRALLQEVPQVYNTQINDVLLTALVQAFARWTGEHSLLIDLEGHGREHLFEDMDISRTVGWFTTISPVLLELGKDDEPGEVLKLIKEQLRRIPNRGISYGLLRYLSKDKATRQKLQALPHAEISFNYLGQLDQVLSESPLLNLSRESIGPIHSPLGQRRYLLGINGFVVEGKLQLEWTYSKNFHQQITIARLAREFMDALQSLIAHCRSPEAGGYTPSDFPDVELSQEQLDQVLAEMGKKDVEAIYPLSLSQQGMLLETLSASESGVHIEQSIWNLSGDFDIAVFEQAWQRVVDRHSILRTGFVWKNLDEPLQVVLQWVQLPIERQDWRDFSATQQQEKLEDYLRADRLSGFNLSKAPLMRLALFQIDKNVYQFVWSFHHILMDGWCLPLIAKEVLAFYEAFSNDRDLVLEPAHPYANYITWLKQQNLSQAEAFWRKRLQGFTRSTPLGIEAKPGISPNQENRYDEQTNRLTMATTTTLQSLARQHHLTLNVLIQGVWALLLSRYSNNSDVLFGATVSGRPADLDGVEATIGLFINTLPIRIKIFPDASLWSWLQDIQTQYLKQNIYEYCSTGQIHQWSEIPGALPLYESILVFENYPVELSIPKSSNFTIDIHSSRFIGAQTKYALTILVSSSPELTFQLVYDCRRFDHPDITLILEHFLTLLNTIVDVSDQRLATLLDRIPVGQIPHVRPLQTHSQQGLSTSFVPPRTSTENTLAAIWFDILGLEQIGIHDNFFELGGHSLLATQIISRIHKEFQVQLPLTDLFEEPTIAKLAETIETIRHFTQEPEIASDVKEEEIEL